jgi:hypothetical protein
MLHKAQNRKALQALIEYIDINWASRGTTISRSFHRVKKEIQEPPDPAKESHFFLLAAPVEQLTKASTDKTKVKDDNWSGASMLPSLYQALKVEPRRHTFIFVAFAAEEKGLVGSKFYVNSLAPDQVKRIDAMVNMDTLGLGPTEVWVSRSDQRLVHAFKGMAEALKLPLTGVNVDGFGQSDGESFVDRKVSTVTIHSLTKETLPVLHNRKDNYGAIHFDD